MGSQTACTERPVAVARSSRRRPGIRHKHRVGRLGVDDGRQDERGKRDEEEGEPSSQERTLTARPGRFSVLIRRAALERRAARLREMGFSTHAVLGICSGVCTQATPP